MVTDFDWAGKSIGENLVRFLKEDTVVQNVNFHPLMKLEHFTVQEISRARTPGARFTREAGEDVPFGATDQEKLDKAKEWFQDVKDPRLMDSRQIGEQRVYTIWKVSVDALPWRKLTEVFQTEIEVVLGEGDAAGTRGRAAGPRRPRRRRRR